MITTEATINDMTDGEVVAELTESLTLMVKGGMTPRQAIVRITRSIQRYATTAKAERLLRLLGLAGCAVGEPPTVPGHVNHFRVIGWYEKTTEYDERPWGFVLVDRGEGTYERYVSWQVWLDEAGRWQATGGNYSNDIDYARAVLAQRAGLRVDG